MLIYCVVHLMSRKVISWLTMTILVMFVKGKGFSRFTCRTTKSATHYSTHLRMRHTLLSWSACVENKSASKPSKENSRNIDIYMFTFEMFILKRIIWKYVKRNWKVWTGFVIGANVILPVKPITKQLNAGNIARWLVSMSLTIFSGQRKGANA